MSWLSTPIPIYQLLILLTVYVLYKELLKILLKALIKKWRLSRDNRASTLQASADPVLHDPALLGKPEATNPLP